MGIINKIPGFKHAKIKIVETKISTLKKEIGIAEYNLAKFRQQLAEAEAELSELKRE